MTHSVGVGDVDDANADEGPETEDLSGWRAVYEDDGAAIIERMASDLHGRRLCAECGEPMSQRASDMGHFVCSPCARGKGWKRR